MKKIEEIEQEYSTYKARTDFLKSTGDFTMFLEVGIEDLKQSIKELSKEIEANDKEQILARIRNFFFFIFGEEALEFYEEDNKVIGEQIALSGTFIGYYNALQELARYQELDELVRLADFATDYYNSNFDYLESRRDSLELARKGITSFNPKYEDTRDSFFVFLDRKIDELSPKKVVEKTNKK